VTSKQTPVRAAPGTKVTADGTAAAGFFIG
jgi:hypothetical protein